MWIKLKKFLAFPVLLFKKWKLKRARKKQEKIANDVSLIIQNEEPIIQDIQKASENIDNELSLTRLEDQIDIISKVKSDLSRKEKNKYNNQLDQLLMRANARLRKLKGLTFEELDLERLIIAQKLILSKQKIFEIRREKIDFAKIRNCEKVLSNVDLQRLNLYPEIPIPVPKEVATQLSELLSELLIDESFKFDENEFIEEIHYRGEPFPQEEVIIRNEEIDDIISYLKSMGVKHFHHVTNVNNIASIENIGLYSWYRLDELKLTYHNKIVDDLSKRLDVHKRKQNFVRLSFCKATPMFLSRVNKLLQTNVVYKISVDCLRECKFEFSDMNATDNLVEIGSSLSFIKNNLRFNLFNKYFPALEDMNKKYYQAEVLIKEHIPSKFIMSKEAL